jgi:hypothetical protein
VGEVNRRVSRRDMLKLLLAGSGAVASAVAVAETRGDLSDVMASVPNQASASRLPLLPGPGDAGISRRSSD